MYTHRRGGSIIYMGSVHAKEASVLKAPYVTAKHGLIGLAQAVAKEGPRMNVMLKETVDGEFTTVQDVAQAALFVAAFLRMP
jgi:3-hydroxybutyrate dehydrogenase